MTVYKVILFGRCIRTYRFNEHVFRIGLLVLLPKLHLLSSIETLNLHRGPLKGDFIIFKG